MSGGDHTTRNVLLGIFVFAAIVVVIVLLTTSDNTNSTTTGPDGTSTTATGADGTTTTTTGAGGTTTILPGCYEWDSWDPSTEKGVPAWLIGGGTVFVPVGTSTGALGATPRSTTDPNYGKVFSLGKVVPTTGPLFGIKATGSCPKQFATTTDPEKALKYKGVPVCWDSSGTSNAFTPFASGKCTEWASWGTFELIKNFHTANLPHTTLQS
jgi:hypothetical protein